MIARDIAIEIANQERELIALKNKNSTPGSTLPVKELARITKTMSLPPVSGFDPGQATIFFDLPVNLNSQLVDVAIACDSVNDGRSGITRNSDSTFSYLAPDWRWTYLTKYNAGTLRVNVNAINFGNTTESLNFTVVFYGKG